MQHLEPKNAAQHFLFVKHELCFPRVSGHDVHTYWMMRALTEAGHRVSLLTVAATSAEAKSGMELSHCQPFSGSTPQSIAELGLTKLQAKFCSYWGIAAQRITEVAEVAKRLSVDVVVAVGLDVLPYLTQVQSAKRIWYAADEWVVHHLSQFSMGRPSSWSNLKLAAIKGLYERAFARNVDRVWLVSQRDANWTRWVMPHVATDVVPNGVDIEHYSQQLVAETERSCVFWGRLDFGPNLDAIRWFSSHVWDAIKTEYPDATFTVLGFKPGPEIDRLAKQHEFGLITDQADIRREICAHQLVVLPFVSGAGIKNKLLEAASMSRPIIASTSALNGVERGSWTPVQSASGRSAWIKAIKQLWENPERRQQLGTDARQWVTSMHTWDTAADRVLTGLQFTRRETKAVEILEPALIGRR